MLSLEPGTSFPLRFIDFDDLKQRRAFPRFPDGQCPTIDLARIERSDSFVVFLSHNWLRGWYGASGWSGYAHPDDDGDEKFHLTIEAVERVKRNMAPGMMKCYVWVDFCCINQDGNPADELNNLPSIIQACDCILTPVVDKDHAYVPFFEWKGSFLESYCAKSWSLYLTRAWCRLEMLLCANLELNQLQRERKRIDKFDLGIKFAFQCNRRPHLLYGSREKALGFAPYILEPLQNEFAEKFAPLAGAVTNEDDKEKLKMFLVNFPVNKVSNRYEGELNTAGFKHGQGKLTTVGGHCYDGEFLNDEFISGKVSFLNGDIYEGSMLNWKFHGKGYYKYASGGFYEGDYENDVRHGHGKSGNSTGRIYEGDFINGLATGFAILKTPVGDKIDVYEGNFNDLKPHGKGKRTYINGDIYEGCWVHGKRHGEGTYTKASSGEILNVSRLDPSVLLFWDDDHVVDEVDAASGDSSSLF
jgi:hypothetical protein